MDYRIPEHTERQFILGGKAIFTLESGITGRRYTYKIVNSKYRPEQLIVKLLVGSDNTKNYKAIGSIYRNSLRFDDFGFLTYDSYPMRAIKFFLEHIDNIPKALHVYHSGRCCFCGRKLTTPEAVKRGYGRKCAKAKGLPYGEKGV